MRILVLFGGESVEHEISIITANQVMNALKINYTVIPLYISKENKLYYKENLLDLNEYKDVRNITKRSNEVSICNKKKRFYLKCKGLKKKKYFDFAFPIVHGKGMEDGTLLAYLKFKKIPVIADSNSFYPLAQNKILTKRVLNDLKIPNSCFIELNKNENIPQVSFPCIVKPNSLGSSIGIERVDSEDELESATENAFKYDKKIIIEEYLENCHEYNISVLEKDNEIIVSDIEEVLKESDILDYSQKYESESKVKGMVSSKRIFPANIDKKVKEEIERYAKKIYKYFDAKGVIRIDFLCNDKVYVNEINSIPGSYSFYLWKNRIDFVELLDIVIDNSKKDFFKDNKLTKTIDKMSIFTNYKSNSFTKSKI